MTQFITPEIRNGMLYWSYSCWNLQYKDFRVLGVNLRTVQTIQKELDESYVNYEGTAGRESHSGRLDKNSLICCWDPDYDTQRSQQANQVNSQRNESVRVSY